MQQLDERKIQEIVERVVARLGAAALTSPAEAVRAHSAPHPQPPAPRKGEVRVPPAKLGVHPDPDSAVKAARKAFEANEAAPPRVRERWISAMREATRKHIPELAKYAQEESGLGRAEDKI